MYIVLFGVGAVFIILSFFIGGLVDTEFEGPAFFAFLKPMLVAIFLVVVGGLGMLLAPHFDFGGGLLLFICAISGFAVAGVVNRFILIPLHRAQNTSAFHIQDAIGATAQVISPIPQGGYGKIRYNVSGSTVTSPAKSEDGNQINSGEAVEIIFIEKSTYFVRRVAQI